MESEDTPSQFTIIVSCLAIKNNIYYLLASTEFVSQIQNTCISQQRICIALLKYTTNTLWEYHPLQKRIIHPFCHFLLQTHALLHQQIYQLADYI